MPVRFEWDPSKAASNFRKHGVEFAEALRVFADPFLIVEQDRLVDGELRWQAIGAVGVYLILTVAHTVMEQEDVEILRIISARPADRKERKRYERENGSV